MATRWEDLETLFSREGFQEDMVEQQEDLETLGLHGGWAEVLAMVVVWVGMGALGLALEVTLGALGATVDLGEQVGILEETLGDLGEEIHQLLEQVIGIIVAQDIRIGGINW